jgi:hypothetical protein
LRKVTGVSHAERRTVRRLLLTVGVVVVCFPVAILMTLLLLPLWSWIEATYAIESVGHSGPAEWCFWLDYIVLTAVSVTALLLHRRRSKLASAEN